MEKLRIGDRLIGPGERPYIIAEIGANHNGEIDLCKRLIDEAKSSGADAVKFQSWSTESLISTAEYARNVHYDDKKAHFGTLEEMVTKYQLTPENHSEIAEYCLEKEITFLSTGFSAEEVDLLESLSVPVHKIASMDINHLPLLEYVGSKRKPVILSTGMAMIGEIEEALTTLLRSGAESVALLHCISIYPPPYQDINLRNISTLRKAFNVPVGFSDHTLGTAIPIAAIALGANIIEKHFTLDKSAAGWDHAISADPMDLQHIVREGDNVFLALGSTARIVSGAEQEKRKAMRRRLTLKHAVKQGETLGPEDITFKRPGTGIHPNELSYVIGRSLTKDAPADYELEWSDLA